MNAIVIVARKELRDAIRSRWLIAFAITFAALALVISRVQSDSGGLGEQGFNRTTAGLINLCLLLVPLLSLILGAGAISGERERGTLATLLSQPITSTELLLGKYLGLTVAVWGALAAGFGGAGLLVSLVEPFTDIGHYLFFVVLSAALACAMLSAGLFVSVLSDNRAKALGAAILLWFFLVLAYDLGAIALALAVASSGRALTAVAVLNPVEAIRIIAVMSLEPDLEILGPLGAYLTERLGTAKAATLLGGAVAAWTVAPLAAAAYFLRNQDA
ncbi:MAG: ABC transporter permease [Dehalococcoidia bacterium]|uniref:ABC transporter permease n=1 Tax=Candidatus Amarobacter glycogenicus TaxID=3140699 RepID=UPI001DFF9CA0|nr:ABC transporter permease [Dehalococcoidia bacterium]MBK6561444.1 ABC transporter permease [Dehalococcoidia bacterium]MBK7127289.1 ABC transporter permease [Dehalococcoidia bacterium]MBK7327764.1 ABC transporter permease [Dehalococcoidia bacterium]MBK7726296.1 ABC transporter permease [Dehalococcoidia bacterium]